MTGSSQHEALVERARSVPVEDVARDRKLKLKRSGRRELVGPCPRCGGDDRFSVNVKEQVWCCRGCSSTRGHRRKGGDVIALVRHIDGCDFPTAVATLAGAAPRPARTSQQRREPAAPVADNVVNDVDEMRRALDVWDEAGDLGTLALDYLTRPRAQGGRGLVISPGLSGRALRFHPRHCWRADDGEVIRVPALLALYRDIRTAAPTAIWRRALTPDGRSRGTPRAMGPKAGCAIMLTASEDVSYGLHIGEGPETVLAAMMEGFAPAWALGDTGGIRDFPLLGGIEALTIIVDHDANGAGQKAASACYDRWAAAGREVWSVIPDKVDADMNDIIGDSP